MKALWLVSWYPDKLAPYDGDFIQRHAKAVALYHNVQVIYVLRDVKGIVTKDVKVEENVSGNLKEKIIHYYSPNISFSLLDRFLSVRKYKRLYRHAVKEYIHYNGLPYLVHVHIAMKAGIIARWIKKKWNVRYILSEHWTGYLPEAKERIFNLSFYNLFLWRKVMNGAAAISVVSNYLGISLQKIFPGINFSVIPNVVNTNIFKPLMADESGTTRFIHISALDYQKNPEDILKALAILKQQHSNFHLVMVGPDRPHLLQMVEELKLQSLVSFHHEVPQEELVKLLQQSHALILYSRYETFGCVIIEAYACGLPVILSDIPVMHENAEEGFNAIFATKENPAVLAERLQWFIQNRKQFSSSAIADRANSNYNYAVVGTQFTNWYKTVPDKV